jgi:hypothetical protein
MLKHCSPFGGVVGCCHDQSLFPINGVVDDHGFHPISVPEECPRACDDHVAFYDALAGLDISFGPQTARDNSGFNSLVADYLHNGALLTVQQRRERNGGFSAWSLIVPFKHH